MLKPKITTMNAGLAMSAAVAAIATIVMTIAGCGSIKQLMIEDHGKVNLEESDLCLNRDGQGFSRGSGLPCKKGDIAYISIPSDADKAGAIVRQYCDFKKQLTQTMDTYGVLCYLRTTPPPRPASKQSTS